MDILGSIKTNYSSNYYNSKRINRSDKGFGNVSSQTATSSITLQLSGKEGEENALNCVGFPNGVSASVYKSEGYSDANILYSVRYWDKDGNEESKKIDPKGVNPDNASFLEMMAYTTYTDSKGITKSGFGDFLNAAGGVNGDMVYNFSDLEEQKNFTSLIRDFMDMQYETNNLKGYLSYKQLYDYIMDMPKQGDNL